MARLNLAPTKSNLLSLKRQLVFAEEGYDLLEQKRQILIFELMSRLKRAQELENEVAELLRRAFAALRTAVLRGGSENLQQAALGASREYEVNSGVRHLMGMRIPDVSTKVPPTEAPFGAGGVAAGVDLARERFAELVPKLAELGGLQTAVIRLATELRKTQRRCNALSKIFIPTYRQTMAYIAGTLEERERESLTILKMIRDKLDSPGAGR